MNNEQEKLIQLQLSISDINLILRALGDRPFKEVYELVGRINAQANQQLTFDDDENEHVIAADK